MMDDAREIVYLNDKAIEFTGWRIGEKVPFCSYCQMRDVPHGEERCILANDDPLPSFRAHMPNYVSDEYTFEMSLNKQTLEGKVYQILVIRNPTINAEKEKLKMQELLIQETMLAQENERKRIARELHDNIGQSVYSLYLGLEGIKRHVSDPEYHARLKKMTAVMDDTLNNLKRLTKELRPQLVDHLGLKSALVTTAKEWQEFYKIAIELQINLDDQVHFQKEEGLHLFRIIQESVRNAVKHGKATSITIELDSHYDYLSFRITDDGIGFDVESVKNEGLGFRHIMERVKMLDGDVKWLSSPGGPTKVEGFIKISRKS